METLITGRITFSPIQTDDPTLPNEVRLSAKASAQFVHEMVDGRADVERRLKQRQREREIVERAYVDLLTAMNVKPGSSMPHCDDLVLHAPRQCEYCDRHQSWQVARIRLGIAFTGNAWNEKGTTLRPCPATLLRSVETIERWYGNVPTEKTIEDEVTEIVARWSDSAGAA